MILAILHETLAPPTPLSLNPWIARLRSSSTSSKFTGDFARNKTYVGTLPSHCVYRCLSDIRSSNDANVREMLAELLKSVELRWPTRNSVFDDLSKLMFHLDLMVRLYSSQQPKGSANPNEFKTTIKVPFVISKDLTSSCLSIPLFHYLITIQLHPTRLWRSYDLDYTQARRKTLVDSCRFICFYDFVFFLCRTNGQKNITIEMALAAWRLVLKGRFRLLNEWCNFVEKHQRYNISEDTWQQVLAFSRCVHEDLEGYDPKGAWPVIIDDFVEYMHRIRTSSCNCCEAEQTCMATDGFPGRKGFTGLKRKPATFYHECEIEPLNSFNSNSWSFDLFSLKRNRKDDLDNKQENWEARPAGDATDDYMDVVKHNGALASACTVEGSLSEGFAGLLSTSPCLHLNQKSVPYT
ncbi:hypothetical protein Sjap_015661 [Stephania japonica]|uniref:Defective in cullin neddylation protein n=1 Tax=Stephania japonica TaxID=461633 RepID=A0AAP0IJJ6_9MAGN